MLRVRYVMVSVLALAISSLPVPAVAAETGKLPSGSRSLFLIDTSSSTDVSGLWRDGLRPSIIQKLQQPFGRPIGEAFGKGRAPSDITLSLINANSQVAPVLKIVALEDAQAVWGTIFSIGGNKPTTRRLEAISADFFGGEGAYTKLAESYLSGTGNPPSQKNCEGEAVNAFRTGQFMDTLATDKRNKAATSLCKIVIRMANALQQADRSVIQSNCRSYCSDVVGAIRRSVALAQDSAAGGKKVPFCLAIASDMVNNFPGMQKSSPLNTALIVKTAKSVDQAAQTGATAATSAGIKFPSTLPVRIFTIGQGATIERDIPVDRMAFLDAYWSGFWKAAGVAQYRQNTTLNEACR